MVQQYATLTATGINTPLLYDSLGHYPGEYARTLTVTADTNNNQVIRVRSCSGELTDIIIDNDLLLTVDPDYQDFLAGEYTLEEGYDFNRVKYDATKQELTLIFEEEG